MKRIFGEKKKKAKDHLLLLENDKFSEFIISFLSEILRPSRSRKNTLNFNGISIEYVEIDKNKRKSTEARKLKNGYKCIKKMDGYAMFAYLKDDIVVMCTVLKISYALDLFAYKNIFDAVGKIRYRMS